VANALRELIEGNVAFNVPERAQVNKSFVIQAKISVNLEPNKLVPYLTAKGKKESVPLLVSNKMSATLSGGAFDIAPSG
jgi:hypothetical protein